MKTGKLWRVYTLPLIALGALTMNVGVANATLCMDGNFSWNSTGANDPPFTCDDQDKRWSFENTNLPSLWRDDLEAIDVTVLTSGGVDTHIIEWKEFEDLNLPGFVIEGNIEVIDDPSTPENERNMFSVDLVDIDTTVAVGPGGQIDITVFKQFFTDALFSMPLLNNIGDVLTLTSVNGALDFSLLETPVKELWFRDTVTITAGTLLTIENSFRQVAVPEPTTLGLFAVGLAGLGFARRRAGSSDPSPSQETS